MNPQPSGRDQPTDSAWAAAVVVADGLNDLVAELDERQAEAETVGGDRGGDRPADATDVRNR